MSTPASRRDAALMGGIALGSFLHLTFLDGHVEQGWLHLHDGQLSCCVTERRDECDAFRQDVADKLYDGVMRQYLPMDVDRLIRIDAAIVASGVYVPLWHHPEHADRPHVLERARLVCCGTHD